MENSEALHSCENIQSGTIFYADSGETKIVSLPQLSGGIDTKRP